MADEFTDDSTVNGETTLPRRSAARKPLPRYRRSEELPALVLQERDVALLEDVWRYRLLTTGQIELLRSIDDRPACRFVSRLTLTRRLKLLFHNGYLHRLARPQDQGSVEPVYVLDTAGARVLSQRQGEVTVRAPSQLPKAAALEHLIAINQVHISVAVACARSVGIAKGEDSSQTGEGGRAELIEWQASHSVKFSTAVMARGDRLRTVTLIPDGFFSLRSFESRNGRQRLFYFVEVDLGTEPARTLADKCRAYYAYWQSGGFAQHFGVPPQISFRTLFVAPTPARAATIARAIATLQHGRSMFWVTTQEHIESEQVLLAVFQDGSQDRVTGALRSLV